jgi:NAD(P)-dependent dehydrogenase (short-subunit alcohol dehydrogenase family)
MKTLERKVVAITGAGSGIGQQLAIQCSELGAALALSDINEKGLAETLEKIGPTHRVLTSQKLDVADRAAVFAWADQVRKDHGTAHVVINNAGVSLSATVAEMKLEDFEWLMNINFWGVVAGTQAFLPGFLAQDEGHVVNVSSIFGIVGIPTQSAYNAAKFAVRGFTESLRQELADTNVRATCVHPGGIKTNIVRGGRHYNDIEGGKADVNEMIKQFDNIARTSPEEAARVIINGILKDKPRVLIGPDAHLMDRLARSLPSSYDKVMMGVTKLGRRFVQ